MKKEQICQNCGKVFLRSPWHPQMVLCEECKKGGAKSCVICDLSVKQGWDLICLKSGKIVTNSACCGLFKSSLSPKEKKEILSQIEYCGGKRWI